jgi:hypothetical protein
LAAARARLSPATLAQAGQRAKALLEAGRLPEAEKLVRELLQQDRTNPDLLMALGVACRRQGRLEEAVPRFRRAVNPRPGFADAHAELGNVLEGLGRIEEASGRYENAVRLRPNDFDSLCRLASLLAQQSRQQEALAVYDRAIALQPEATLPQWQKGLVLLTLGQFDDGWSLYATRPGPALERSPAPVWRGERRIAGQTVLLRAEQGMGDVIQFARYAPLVAALGARTVVQVHTALTPLFEGAPGFDRVLKFSDELPPHDWQCLLMDLPGVFWEGLDKVPPAPYLTAPAASVATWAARLGPADRMRIGVVWAGNPTNKNDRNRSMKLPLLLPLLRSAGAEFIVLQKDMTGEDRRQLASMPQVRLVGDELTDFAETAGVLSACDLVITVDTAVAHVAGAIGRPVWILLPYCPDWRWLLERPNTPWYPSARLFRQPKPQDWASVVAEVLAALPGAAPAAA